MILIIFNCYLFFILNPSEREESPLELHTTSWNQIQYSILNAFTGQRYKDVRINEYSRCEGQKTRAKRHKKRVENVTIE
ncbi:MAG: hypothetical protein SFU25_03425 [Candidatus Caenarcaniphilales bacterium]|nr:hypothetical protein [Candidatus Caenarcaniphilales bacterium]